MAEENVTYPLGAPSVSGNTFTADFLLANPTRVTRAIRDITLQRFFVDRIFAQAGDITGGAVIYEQATSNELFAARDVQRVEPGREFPEITFDRGAPRTAQVEKLGGKFAVTDEAIRRNQDGRVRRAVEQVANTIQRKIQQRALAELAAAVTEHARTATGTNWLSAAGLTSANRSPVLTPINDLTEVERQNEIAQLGYRYDLAVMHPQEWRNFRLAAGGDSGTARETLADSGINDVWVTASKAAGSVFWLAERQVGELGYEVPLTTETWRDPDGRQQSWWQTSALPVMYVVEPFAILQTTGHAG